jgi:hypothetical protein
MNTIPLNTFLSSTLGLPRDFGKYGFSRSICPSDNQKSSLMIPPHFRSLNHATTARSSILMGPDPRSEEAGLRFLPVEIVAEARLPAAAPVADNCIEIDLAGGHRMRISGGYDPEALARLIRGLTV